MYITRTEVTYCHPPPSLSIYTRLLYDLPMWLRRYIFTSSLVVGSHRSSGSTLVKTSSSYKNLNRFPFASSHAPTTITQTSTPPPHSCHLTHDLPRLITFTSNAPSVLTKTIAERRRRPCPSPRLRVYIFGFGTRMSSNDFPEVYVRYATTDNTHKQYCYSIYLCNIYS